MRMKTAQILMECLLEQGVDTVFGYPGGTILNVYDEFELHGYKDKIRHILTPTSRAPPTPPTAMPAPPERWGCASPPPAPGPPT